MRSVTVAAVTLALASVVPVSASAQFRLSDIRVADVERAVRVGVMVYEATKPERRGPSRTDRGGSGSGTATSTSGASGGRLASRVIATGDDLVGVPYKWGGNTPSEGLDCSGFTKYVFGRNGVTLPRTSRTQAQVGEWIEPEIGALRQGDLLFFAGNGRTISHVAIYVGANRILHSSSSGNGVRYDDLGTRRGNWYVTHLVAARRVVEDGRSLVNALAAGRLAFDYFDPPDLAPRR